MLQPVLTGNTDAKHIGASGEHMWRIYLPMMLVGIDLLALIVILIAAYALSDTVVRGAFDIWNNLHRPTSSFVHDIAFPGRRSMHDSLPVGPALGFFVACLAQTALIGWVVGRIVDYLHR